MSAGETIDATDHDLLMAVKGRLHDKISKLESDGLVMICDEPIPPDAYFPRGELCCSIAVTDGVFDKANYQGGGANVLTEKKQLVVTVFSRVKIDQPPRAQNALLDTQRGMLTAYKPQVLLAILVDDPMAEILAPWEPSKDGKAILRESICPDRCRGPIQVPNNPDWLGMHLFFDVEFDWNLRTPITE